MPISIADLAKELSLAPEAVQLHALDLDCEIGEDDMIPDDIASQIRKIELGDVISQTTHKFEEQMEREIKAEQAKKTAGNQKKIQAKKEKQAKEKEPEVIEIIQDADGKIILPDMMTVREFATKISKPLPLVLIKLKQNGIIANLKSEVDYETAAIVAGEMKVVVKKEAVQLTGEDLFRGNLDEILAAEDVDNLELRTPVVSIMGHVDHGKTSILDYIRKAKIADGEAGGITQRIGAYQVDVQGKPITFLDTPGHEAFTTMRARGAQATDIAILVVAATEGLKPQSIEAINHAKAAGIPIIVAINKMDLDGANPDLVKGQLGEHDLTPEDWGGDTPCVPVSAKTGLGIDALLDTITIVAEMQDLKVNHNRNAIATVIESSMDKQSGVSATVLINAGTMQKGDPFVIYNQHGKIRSMKDFRGNDLKLAGPSVPVQISGLSELPRVGDLLQVMESEKIARKQSEEVASIKHEDDLSKRKKFSLAHLKAKIAEGKMDQLKVIVKAESNGTLEAVISEIEKVKTEQGFAKVVHSGVGEIAESDIMLAAAGDTIVVGFAVNTPGRIQKIADKEGIKILEFDVIYHLTEKLQNILEGQINQEDEEENIGTFSIKAVFASNKKMAVIGGAVVSGKVRKLCKFRLMRESMNEDKVKEVTIIGEGKIETVQKGQQSVNEASEGSECGMKVEHNELEFLEGDQLELYVSHK